MPKHSKRFQAADMAVRGGSTEPPLFSIEQAVDNAVKTASAKFDETVEAAIRLGVDPRKADQNVRGAVVLPHGTGNKARVLVLARGPKEKEAADAGADYVGNDEYLQKIQEGWLDFEKLIATPDMMRDLGRLGKVLGPRGLMPSPKTGSVTLDVAKAVEEAKAGKIEFRVDKAGIVHAGIGKVSFGSDKVRENLMALINDLQRRKPSTSKGAYFKSLAVSTTMGPGVRIDPAELRALA